MTNLIITTRKFEILQNLPKCDTETQSEQMLLENNVPVDLFDTGLPWSFNWQKTKNQKTHSVCEVQ